MSERVRARVRERERKRESEGGRSFFFVVVTTSYLLSDGVIVLSRGVRAPSMVKRKRNSKSGWWCGARAETGYSHFR